MATLTSLCWSCLGCIIFWILTRREWLHLVLPRTIILQTSSKSHQSSDRQNRQNSTVEGFSKRAITSSNSTGNTWAIKSLTPTIWGIGLEYDQEFSWLYMLGTIFCTPFFQHSTRVISRSVLLLSTFHLAVILQYLDKLIHNPPKSESVSPH